MKTLKRYWRRFFSKTPKDLRRLQKLLAVMAIGSGSAYGLLLERGMNDTILAEVLSYASVAIAFAIPIINLAVENPEDIKD